MKKLLFVALGVFGFGSLAYTQCEVSAIATPNSIVCGESVVLSAFGSSTGSLVLDEDFNTGGFGPGWSSTPGATSFTNPCSPAGVDGTPHAWMDNNTTVPRALTSANYDLSTATAGVTICFDMLFATQGNAAPCEGPDEPDEGVYLQYSIDGGATWIDIHYFDPNGGNDPMLTNWNNWCFQVPAAAITSNTMFQWYQEADSGADYDHWGIDNVQIFMNDINSEIVWLHDGYSYGIGNPGGDNPTPVTPTTTTTYTAQITTGTGAICTQDVTVTVLPPNYNVNIAPLSATICDGDCATISGTAEIIADPGGIETYENAEVALISGTPGLPGLPPFIPPTPGDITADMNINVVGINQPTVTSGLITTICINNFNIIPMGGGTVSLADVDIVLTCPSGTSITLVNQGDLSGLDISNMCFEMGAPSVATGTAPYSGTFAPAQSFDLLNGCNSEGVWNLTISGVINDFTIPLGSITGWNITFNDPPVYQSVCTSWSPVAGLSAPGSLNTDACPTVSTNYTLTVDNCVPGCPTYTETVAITVNPCGGCTPPNIIINNLQACSPNTVDLTNAIGAGSDPATLTYYNSQVDAQNATNPIGSVVGTSGSYWVRAEDPADPSCFQEYEILVTINDLSYSASVVDENCGAADGQISLTPNLGVGPYSYSIDGGTTTQGTGTFTGLSAGVYNILITDNTTGCTTTGVENVSNLGGPSIDLVTPVNPSCPGLCDGSISITVSGGNPPYTYQWYDDLGNPIGTNSANITGLCAGNYSVDVSDAAGGTTTLFYDDFETGAAGWSLNVSLGGEGADPNFFEVDDDEGGVAVGGCGIANNGDATLHITSVFNPAGGAAYDAGGLCGLLFCPETHRQAETPMINTVGQTGLTLNFDYIANGSAPQDQATVWYDDGGGWTQLGGALFSGTGVCAPQGIWTAYSSALPASCENIPNLRIAIRWDNNDDGVGTDPSVAINNMEVITIGGAACTATQFATLTDPAPADASFTLTDFCLGDPNSATAIVTPGGTFAYNPNPGDGSSVNPATGEITNGVLGTTYTVEYTTPGACPVTSTQTVTVNGFTYNAVLTDENCGSLDGQIDLSTVGGTPAFTYSVDNGATTQGSGLFTGLAAGNYDILITDNNGCTATGIETLNNIGGPTINSITPVDPTCAGLCDGSITITVSGGTMPYSYQWFDALGNPIGTNAATINGLCAADYSVEVFDAGGICSATNLTTLVDPLADDPSFTLTDFCEGSANSATGVVTPGGTFVYNPNPGDGSTIDPTTGEITNGVLGTTYTVEYTTPGACPQTSTNTVTVIGFSYTAVVTDENCGASDGSIDLTPVGGTPTYTYSIDGGTTTQGAGLFTGLVNGNYNVVITDGNGCQATGVEVVANVGGPTITSITPTNPSCAGLCDGSITVTVAGGVPPYTYQWFDGLGNPIGPDAATITGLCADNYSVEVTDANGGTSTQLNTNSDFENGTGGGCDCPPGYICNNDAGQVFDGNHPNWAPGSQGCVTGATNYTNPIGANSGTGYVYFYAGADNISTGPFAFVGGEQVELCVWYSGPPAPGPPGQNTAASHFSFGVDGAQVGPDVPVPAGTGWTQFCFTVTMTAGNHTFEILSGGAAQYSLWFDDFTITDISGGGGGGCPALSNTTLTDPLADDPSFTLTDFCAGDANSATGIITPGGTFAYNPVPMDGSTVDPVTGEITNGIAGSTYTVEYTTPGACPQTATSTVTVNGFTYNAIITHESCAGVGGDGSIDLTTNGGTPAFAYSIDNGVTTQGTGLFNNLSAGTYTILITDANGCSASGIEDVLAGGSPTIDLVTSTDASCNGVADGTIQVTSSGGTGALDYEINDGAGYIDNNATGSFTNVPGGNYTITVTDASGCTATDVVTINEPAAIVLDVLRTDILCFGQLTGEINLTANGGTPVYNFSIDNGATWSGSGTFTGLAAGNYNAIAEDANGCQSLVAVVIITEPAQLVADVSATNESCFGSCDGTITWSGQGGTAGYSFEHNGTPAAASPISGLCPGTFDYVLTDANGCIVVGQIDIEAANEIIPDPVSIVDDGCSEDCDGSIAVSSNTGVTYTMNGISNNTGEFFNLCSGFYTVTIDDANGCSTSVDAVVSEAEGVEANFAYTPGYVTALENEVQLINTSYNADSYIWTITGVNNGLQESFDYDIMSYEFPADSGAYQVCLIAINDTGCQDTMCAPIVVQDIFTLYVPNTFTPDGDEFNQTFMAYVNGIDDYNFDMYIFNRWGEMIWESHDKTVGWDGTYKGRIVQEGIYTWKIVVKDPYRDDRRTYVGHVSVLK
jgi:gliding motility-associated-like protein